MDVISKSYSLDFARFSFNANMRLDSVALKPQNPLRMGDKNYYNQHVSLNIFTKAVQLYNDIVDSRAITADIESLQNGLSADNDFSLSGTSLNDLLKRYVDVHISDLPAKARLNIST